MSRQVQTPVNDRSRDDVRDVTGYSHDRKVLLLVTGPYLYTHAPEGSTYLPNEMGVYYGTELSAVVHTNYTPLSKNPHLEPRFSDGGWVFRRGVGAPRLRHLRRLPRDQW